MKFLTICAAMISASVLAQDTNTTTTPTPAPDAASTPAIETPAPAPAMTAAPALEPAPTAAPEPTKVEPAKKKPAKKKPAAELKTVPLLPGPAVVSATRVNVRGTAGLKGEIVARLTNGEPVTVLEEIRLKRSAADEPSVWAKIVLPEKVPVWVHTSYLDKTSKTVSVRKLNLRAGAGENFSVLGELKRGDAVKEIEAKGSWLKIEAPAGCYAFMAAQYLTQESAAIASTGALPGAGADAGADMTQMTVVIEPTEASAGTTIELAGTTPADPVADAAAATPAVVTDPSEPPPPRIVSHEGLVRGATSIQAPTSYELVNPQTRKIVNYLYTTSTNLDLSRYKGLTIIVTGEEGLDERWRNTPVITIRRIDVVE